MTISLINWRVGKRSWRVWIEQEVLAECPTKLEYSERKNYTKVLSNTDEWFRQFAANIGEYPLSSLVLQVNTTVGHVESIKPDQKFLDRVERHVRHS